MHLGLNAVANNWRRKGRTLGACGYYHSLNRYVYSLCSSSWSYSDYRQRPTHWTLANVSDRCCAFTWRLGCYANIRRTGVETKCQQYSPMSSHTGSSSTLSSPTQDMRERLETDGKAQSTSVPGRSSPTSPTLTCSAVTIVRPSESAAHAHPGNGQLETHPRADDPTPSTAMTSALTGEANL